MNFVHEGTSTLRPQFLDGANYAYSKVRMVSFMKSKDSKCWKVVISRWEPPSTKDGADPNFFQIIQLALLL